jgi:excisionase family DNA binding protein
MKYYSTSEVADMFKVKKITVQEWVRTEKITAIKVGNKYMFTDDDIKHFEEVNRK